MECAEVHKVARKLAGIRQEESGGESQGGGGKRSQCRGGLMSAYKILAVPEGGGFAGLSGQRLTRGASGVGLRAVSQAWPCRRPRMGQGSPAGNLAQLRPLWPRARLAPGLRIGSPSGCLARRRRPRLPVVPLLPTAENPPFFRKPADKRPAFDSDGCKSPRVFLGAQGVSEPMRSTSQRPRRSPFAQPSAVARSQPAEWG